MEKTRFSKDLQMEELGFGNNLIGLNNLFGTEEEEPATKKVYIYLRYSENRKVNPASYCHLHTFYTSRVVIKMIRKIALLWDQLVAILASHNLLPVVHLLWYHQIQGILWLCLFHNPITLQSYSDLVNAEDEVPSRCCSLCNTLP